MQTFHVSHVLKHWHFIPIISLQSSFSLFSFSLFFLPFALPIFLFYSSPSISSPFFFILSFFFFLFFLSFIFSLFSFSYFLLSLLSSSSFFSSSFFSSSFSSSSSSPSSLFSPPSFTYSVIMSPMIPHSVSYMKTGTETFISNERCPVTKTSIIF